MEFVNSLFKICLWAILIEKFDLLTGIFVFIDDDRAFIHHY